MNPASHSSAGSAPAPSAEHMLGHGYYNKNSHAQGAAGQYGLTLITQAMPSIDLARAGDTLRLADYGSAQGHNSLLPFKSAIQALNPLPASITVTHTDLPTNDWTTLFQTVLFSPNTYLTAAPNIFPFASGTSIYQQIFPLQQIAFGYSAVTTHWLSRKPCNIPDHIWSARATDETHTIWAKQARDDWYAFLHHRAAEMIPSGQLVMVNSGADKNGNSGAEPLVELANQVLQAMVKDGSLAAAEYSNMAIPTYYRTESGWREPFEDAAFQQANHLQLLHYQEVALPDVYLDQFAQTGDANAFAKSDAAFFNAAYEPVLFAALDSSRTPASRQQVIDTFTSQMETALAQNPNAYFARWVLQLMWVARERQSS